MQEIDVGDPGLPVKPEEHRAQEFIQAITKADRAARRRATSMYPGGFLPPGAVEGFGNLPLSSAVRANYYPATVQARQLLNLQTDEYRLPSFMASDSSPLSNIFYSYRDAAMEMLSNGVPALQVLGPSDRIDLELFFRDREPHDAYDAHSWACELVKNVADYDVFVKLASIALYTTYMRVSLIRLRTTPLGQPSMQTQKTNTGKSGVFYPRRRTTPLCPR